MSNTSERTLSKVVKIIKYIRKRTFIIKTHAAHIDVYLGHWNHDVGIR